MAGLFFWPTPRGGRWRVGKVSCPAMPAGPADDRTESTAAFDGRLALRRLRIAFAFLAIAAVLFFATSRALRVVPTDYGDGTIEFHFGRSGQLLSVIGLSCLVCCVVFALRSRVWFPGYVLAIAATLMLLMNVLLDAPGFRARVVLATDHVEVRPVGFIWTSHHRIPWADISVISARHEGDHQRVTFARRGNAAPIDVPLGTELSAAFPELRNRAAARGIDVIDDR
jgi:hypothetical protein